MTYLPPAARQFIAEIRALREDAEIEPSGEPDGIGVIRSISLDVNTADWLNDIMLAVDDRRITEWTTDDEGGTVTFTHDHHADIATPFDLAGADAVLYEDGDVLLDEELDPDDLPED